MNRHFEAVVLFLAVLWISSCAPAKKQTFMYNEDRSSIRTYQEAPTEYKLQPGDILSVKISSLTPTEFNFFENPSNSNRSFDPVVDGFLVDSEGYIVLPQIGNLLVRGLTVREAQDKIRTVVSQYLDSPNVYVRLASFHFTLLGEVNRQGKYPITEDKINILEAIGTGLGLTEFANFEEVRVIRSINGQSVVGSLNLLSPTLPSSEYYYLQPNDIVVVNQLENKNFRRNSSSNLALIFAGLGTIATIIIAYDRLSE